MARKQQPARRSKRTKQKEEEVIEEEEVVEEEEDVDDQVESDGSDEGSDDGGGEDNDSESESESDGEEDVAASLFKGPKEESDSDDDSDGDENMDDTNTPSSALQSEAYTVDLRNMLAINTDQLEMGTLYDAKGAKKSNSGKDIEIPLDPIRGANLEVNEEYLLLKATDGCTQLIQSLWELPTEVSDAGPLVTLPTYDEVRLPRAMPPPPPKQETKWEKFAKAKGLPLNKEKRSRKVWDEASGSWMYRHGYEKANKKDGEWPIMEVGANDNPFDDPWEKQRDEKRTRVDRNVERRMKNEERAGNLNKGATNRAVKAKQQKYEVGKEAGRKDSKSLPSGVPVDLKNSVDPRKIADNKQRGKRSTLAALSAVQKSTASLGKFDRMREGEPERKKSLAQQKKRKFENPTDKKVIMSEGKSSMKILNAVMNGGGVSKAKAIRKGKFATGETAYDYDYNDGLGASSFKKKKGRGGAGKMKKMTKKRAK